MIKLFLKEVTQAAGLGTICRSFCGLSGECLTWKECSQYRECISTRLSSFKSQYHRLQIRSFSGIPETTKDDTAAIEDFIDQIDKENFSWWSLYVRGKVPDYPPRKEMFRKLTEEGIDVERMHAYEVEDFTRWLLMRKKYGEKYPKMPYDITLEQKIAELKRRIPLKGVVTDRQERESP